MEDLISVIVPVYKVEAYLDDCVKSIVRQTYRNLEIILVDDGSPDNSGAMCDAWKVRDNRIKVLHQENFGLSGARNTGLEHCEGLWVMFMDSDDVLHPQAVEKLYKGLRAVEGAQIACARFERHVQVPTGWLNSPLAEVEPVCLREKALWNFFYTNEINTQMVVAWNKLYRKSLFEGIRYPLGRIHEDEFLAYRLLYLAKTVVWVELPLYCYRQRADSIMGHESTKSILDAMDAFVERSAFMLEHVPEFAVKDYEVFTAQEARAERLCAENPRALVQIRKRGKKLFWGVWRLLPADQKRGGIFHYTFPRLYDCYFNWKKKHM